MGLGHSPSIIVDGLIFHIDPNNPRCYSGSGNTIYNLVNPSIGGTFVGFTANPIDNTETRSLAYNGSTTYQEFGPVQPLKYSVSVWFKATGAPSLNDIYGGTLLGFNPQYPGNVNFVINYRWLDNTVITFHNSAGNVTTSSTVLANKVTHAVCTYDGSFIRLYIDGILNTSVSQTSDLSYPGSGNLNLQLGRWGHPGYERYFNGNIYQASIYNRALSASEILQNYNAKRKKFYPEENIVSDGLVLHIDPSKNTSYPGTGNTIYDLSGSGNTGTLVSSPVFSSVNGGNLVFNGNSYITRSSALDTGQNFSVTAWIYPTSLSGGGRNAIIGNGYSFSTDNGWFFCISNNNFGTFQSLMVSLGIDNLIKISNSYVFQLNKWTHVAMTVSGGGSSVKLYANGVETTYGFSGGAARSLVYTTNEFHIGMRHSATPERFAGSISQVQIYNRTLSTAEIQQNYNATKGRFVNALLPVRDGLILELDAANRASYPGTGNTWYDLSGNSLNGTLTNGPTFSGIGATSSLVFDGSNDYVDIPSTLLVNASSFTYEAVFKITTAADGNSLLSLNYSSPSSGYLVRQTTGNYLIVYTNNGTEPSISSNSTILNNTIYHLTVVQSGGSCSIYFNGTLDKTASLANPVLTSSNPTFIGRRGLPIYGAQLLGNIYTTKLYNRALSAYEVKQNFDYYRTRYNI